MEISIEDADLDSLYTSGLSKFSSPAPPEVKVPNAADVKEDYYKGFRSAVVLVWMFCNAVLIAVVLKSGGLSRLSVRKGGEGEIERRKSEVVEGYLMVVLWSVVSFSFIFLSCLFLFASCLLCISLLCLR